MIDTIKANKPRQCLFIVNLRKLKLFWILSGIKENFIFYNCLLASIKTTIFPPEIKFFLIHMLSTNLIIQNIGNTDKIWRKIRVVSPIDLKYQCHSYTGRKIIGWKAVDEEYGR